MPDITALTIGLATAAIIVGVVIGWLSRASRCKQEKAAINAGWQEQLEAKSVESNRLQEQNKSLMEQVSHFQASGKDANNRARELSTALKEAFTRRDELQREIKDIRSNLEAAVAERRRLRFDMQNLREGDSNRSAAIAEKDAKIQRLSKELENWQDRLPPLMDKFRERNEQAAALESELAEAQAKIAALEGMMGSEETRVEPMDRDALADAMEASNDPVEPDDPGELRGEDATSNSEMLPAAAMLEEPNPASETDATFVDEADVAAELPVDPNDEDEHDEIAAAEVPGADATAEVATVEKPEADATGEVAAVEETEAEDDVPADEDASIQAEAAEVDEDASPDDEPAGGLRDNLKLIKGVGPAIEKTLNELGIFRYIQIAEMSEYDIDRIARRLKGFRSRIYREDWIGQARELHDQKAGEHA